MLKIMQPNKSIKQSFIRLVWKKRIENNLQNWVLEMCQVNKLHQEIVVLSKKDYNISKTGLTNKTI